MAKSATSHCLDVSGCGTLVELALRLRVCWSESCQALLFLYFYRTVVLSLGLSKRWYAADFSIKKMSGCAALGKSSIMSAELAQEAGTFLGTINTFNWLCKIHD